MAVFTMCNDISCPSRARCYRYKAVPRQKQEYFDQSPRMGEFGCPQFWPDTQAAGYMRTTHDVDKEFNEDNPVVYRTGG